MTRRITFTPRKGWRENWRKRHSAGRAGCGAKVWLGVGVTVKLSQLRQDTGDINDVDHEFRYLPLEGHRT